MDPEPDSDLDVDEYQKNVRFSGAGETGRIMGMYMQHKMIEASGEAACNQPSYNRKIWDDRGNWFQAPTPRKIIDIAISIVATIYCGPVGAMIVNMLDDALFTMMDIANGADMMGSLESFGKSAAISVVTSKIGGGFANAGGAVGANMFGQTVVGTTLAKGLEITAKNVASSAINAVSVRGLVTGGKAFDSKAFAQGAFGKEAMAGVVAGMAGHAASTSLGKMNIMTNAGNNLTGVSKAFNVGAMRALNSTASGLVSAAVSYGLTGKTTVNLLTPGMFGLKDRYGNPVNVGLFELSLGKDGVHGALGMGGYDLNLGNMAKCFKGYEESRRVFQMKHSGEANNTALEAIAMFDHTQGAGGDDYENYKLARELANGTKRVALTDGVSTDGTNYRGMVDPNDSSVININQSMIGSGTLEDYAKVASVMSHEGAHAYGEHVESNAYAYGGDSYLQMVRNVGLRGNGTFLGEMVKATLDPKNQMVNEQGMQEFWKAVMDKKTGTYSFQWDKQDNFDLTEMGIPGTVSYQDILADPKKFAALLSGSNLSATNAAVTADQLKAMATVSSNKVALQDHLKVYTAAEDKENFAFNKDLLTTFQGSLLALQNMGCISGVGESLVNTSLQKGSVDGKVFYAPASETAISTLFNKRLNIDGINNEDNPLGTIRNQTHKGIDIAGAKQYYSSSGGTMTLDQSSSLGFYSKISNAVTGIDQLNAHNGSETINDYMSLWGRNASGLSFGNKTYSLLGVEAGAQVGTYASTGLTGGEHLHVEYTTVTGNVNPGELFTTAGISMKPTANALAYSGYHDGVDPSSQEFAAKLFSQSYASLKPALAKDIISVLDANNLWNSEGFNSLPTDTVTSYFKNWWSSANALQKQNMYDYANRKQIGGYMAWKKLPYDAQQQYPYRF